MSAVGPATRQHLLRTQRRLARVEKGIGLLRRKREALVVELFRLARPAAGLRAAIGARATTAYPALRTALAAEGMTGLQAIGWPVREVEIEVRGKSVWGIAVSEILQRPAVRRTLAARGTAPPHTGAAAIAAGEFEILTELLLDAAGQEALLRRLGEALQRTSRQVNTLERRIGPALEAGLVQMRRTLDERERDEHLRLRRLTKGRGAGR